MGYGAKPQYSDTHVPQRGRGGLERVSKSHCSFKRTPQETKLTPSGQSGLSVEVNLFNSLISTAQRAYAGRGEWLKHLLTRNSELSHTVRLTRPSASPLRSLTPCCGFGGRPRASTKARASPVCLDNFSELMHISHTRARVRASL